MRKTTWKQDTPKMQAVAITSGIEGWLLNLEAGVCKPERVLEQLKPLLADLKELHQVGMLEQWPVKESP